MFNEQPFVTITEVTAVPMVFTGTVRIPG